MTFAAPPGASGHDDRNEWSRSPKYAGKLLVACLIETLILTAERFSPWGYATDECGIVAPALALA
jgi:hypothetical protein